MKEVLQKRAPGRCTEESPMRIRARHESGSTTYGLPSSDAL